MSQLGIPYIDLDVAFDTEELWRVIQNGEQGIYTDDRPFANFYLRKPTS